MLSVVFELAGKGTYYVPPPPPGRAKVAVRGLFLLDKYFHFYYKIPKYPLN